MPRTSPNTDARDDAAQDSIKVAMNKPCFRHMSFSLPLSRGGCFRAARERDQPDRLGSRTAQMNGSNLERKRALGRGFQIVEETGGARGEDEPASIELW